MKEAPGFGDVTDAFRFAFSVAYSDITDEQTEQCILGHCIGNYLDNLYEVI